MDSRAELIRFGCALVIVFTQYWTMNEHNFPLYAAVWYWITRIAQRMATVFGWLALRAEYNYYLAVEMSQ